MSKEEEIPCSLLIFQCLCRLITFKEAGQGSIKVKISIAYNKTEWDGSRVEGNIKLKVQNGERVQIARFKLLAREIGEKGGKTSNNQIRKQVSCTGGAFIPQAFHPRHITSKKIAKL